MPIPTNYDIATDDQFRILTGFSGPVRAGKVTAIQGSGQVTVEMDDQDGGNATAWPLNGFTYAVDDVVFVLFANNHPENGIVVGSKNAADQLELSPLIAALIYGGEDSGDDLTLESTSNATKGDVILQPNGGNVGIGTSSPSALFHAYLDTGNLNARIESNDGRCNLLVISGADDKFAILILNQDGGNRYDVGMAEDSSGTFRIGNASFGEKYLAITQDGYFGLNVDDPANYFHLRANIGGFMMTSVTAIQGTAIIFIANATGDVTDRLRFESICKPAAGAGQFTSGTIAVSASASIYNSGGENVNIAVNANGSVQVRRTTGSATYQALLRLMWI